MEARCPECNKFLLEFLQGECEETVKCRCKNMVQIKAWVDGNKQYLTCSTEGGSMKSSRIVRDI